MPATKLFTLPTFVYTRDYMTPTAGLAAQIAIVYHCMQYCAPTTANIIEKVCKLARRTTDAYGKYILMVKCLAANVLFLETSFGDQIQHWDNELLVA